MPQKDQYNEPIIFEFPNMIARVYTPILEPEERERRMKAIHRAAANIIRRSLENEYSTRNTNNI